MKQQHQSAMVDAALLTKIDKLFACGVGDQIALPQLVVVGDQSSGKSSVLEGLTALPFPRDSGLCTRFATQIMFRRAVKESLAVSVLPSPGSSNAHIDKLHSWRKTLPRMDPGSFAAIMREVHELMNLGGQDGSDGKQTFSEDVLKLEVSGPDQEHFSVVDVPGIFRKATDGVTTKADLELVRSMVRSYMKNPRSVVLAVIPANVDIATQEILTMAEEFDVDGVRTIGVLTKPDLVDVGAEGPVMDLINGKKHKLNLGWYLVRNLGQNQLGGKDIDRSALETAFFKQKEPWSYLDEDKVGISALRARLQEVLASHIRREFPKVKNELNKQLNAKKLALANLGPKRESSGEQTTYLLQMSTQFRDITTMALTAQYTGSTWFDKCSNSRLATTVVTRNESLSNTIEHYGHSYKFDLDRGSNKPKVVEPTLPKTFTPNLSTFAAPSFPLFGRNVSSGGVFPSTPAPGTVDAGAPAPSALAPSVLFPKAQAPAEVVKIKVREAKIHEDLEDLMLGQHTLDARIGQGIIPWLSGVYNDSRGFELGIFDSSMLATTMKTQSVKWEPIAYGYIADIVSMVHGFIEDLLKLVCPDERVRTEITSKLMEKLIVKYNGAIDHVRFLLDVERAGTPATLNHYFNDNLEKCRQNRMRAAIESKALPHTEDGRSSKVVRIDDIVHSHPMSNTEHIVIEMHDILKSYYKVARKRFVDNLCMQAADYHLITGPDSPLRLFSPQFISELSEEQLAEIAGEDAALKRRRTALSKAIKNLEEGKKILR